MKKTKNLKKSMFVTLAVLSLNTIAYATNPDCSVSCPNGSSASQYGGAPCECVCDSNGNPDCSSSSIFGGVPSDPNILLIHYPSNTNFKINAIEGKIDSDFIAKPAEAAPKSVK